MSLFSDVLGVFQAAATAPYRIDRTPISPRKAASLHHLGTGQTVSFAECHTFKGELLEFKPHGFLSRSQEKPMGVDEIKARLAGLVRWWDTEPVGALYVPGCCGVESPEPLVTGRSTGGG